MPNLKISQLTAGSPAQGGDLFPIDRSGSNFSIDCSSLILTNPSTDQTITGAHALILSDVVSSFINKGTYGPPVATLPAFLAGVAPGAQNFTNDTAVSNTQTGNLFLNSTGTIGVAGGFGGQGTYFILLSQDQTGGAVGFESDIYDAGTFDALGAGVQLASYYAYAEHDSAGKLENLYAGANQVATGMGSGLVNTAAAFYAYAPAFSVNPTAYIAFYSQDLGGGTNGVNPYYFWNDSRGVYRIKEDATHNSVGQAVPAQYNPQFTKYTPGAANFERLTQYWDTNIASFGAEAGGTGTLRKLKLIGASLIGPTLPTSDPGVSGEFYTVAGVVHQSP